MPENMPATNEAELKGETSVVIQAPPSAVYNYLVDLGRHSEWVENVSKVWQVTPGEIGVGTRYRTQESAPPVSTLPRMQMTFYFIVGLITGTKPYSEAQITELEPETRIAWLAGLRKGDGWFNQAQWELIVEPQAQATRVTQRFVYMPQTQTAARMISAAGPEGIAQACSVSLQKLKELMEARSLPAL